MAMSEYKNIIETLEAAADEENSLEEKYIFLRSAYSEVIETMAGDAAGCQYAADRYMILQKIMHQVSELASIL